MNMARTSAGSAFQSSVTMTLAVVPALHEQVGLR
jgi:hypothetical protein